ncbi:MAG: site-specific integrase [Desulfobacterium sp.]
MNPLRKRASGLCGHADSQGKESDGIEIQVLSLEEIARFLDAVSDQKHHVLFSLAIFSGARQGELLGLKWSDILWEDSQIHIQRSFNNQEFYDTKTKGSNRKIDIGPVMLAKLKEWKIDCPSGDLDLVFPTATGNPTNHNNMVNRFFIPALEAAGLETIRFHAMRHTYASLLISQGENIKYIQVQMGHSNPTVALNVYAHLMEDQNQGSARRLEGAIFPTGHNMVTK